SEGMCMFSVPEVGAGVWVAFQNKDGQPDTTYPVWLGVWQAEKESPEEIDAEPEDAHYYKEIKTTSGHSVMFCDKPDEEFIEVKSKDGGCFRFDCKDEFIEIKDKSGTYFRLDDKEEIVEIHDKKGSYILMKEGNIEIHAAENMEITASRIDLNKGRGNYGTERNIANRQPKTAMRSRNE
ncbi:MAG: hypothetical protein IJQ58_07590, partial [Synergistaceae bacterium]|nr:hypothetical protein [Synergistaceae bacterium]